MKERDGVVNEERSERPITYTIEENIEKDHVIIRPEDDCKN